MSTVASMRAVAKCFGASYLYGSETVSQHRRQNLDHLAIAVIRAPQLASNTLQAGRQRPILERGAVAQCAGLLGEHRHVMPGIVDCLAAAEAATMLTDDRPVLADHDAIGTGLDLNRPPHGARGDRVLVVVEPHRAGLRDRG